jgi:ATP-binding cassette, sub-family E, member 1
MIRSLVSYDNYVIAVEHDLSILDYLSDFICLVYGYPGSYGVFTMPYSVGKGINIFLSGFIDDENVRFRDGEITFSNENVKEKVDSVGFYPAMIKTIDSFKITIQPGEF